MHGLTISKETCEVENLFILQEFGFDWHVLLKQKYASTNKFWPMLSTSQASFSQRATRLIYFMYR